MTVVKRSHGYKRRGFLQALGSAALVSFTPIGSGAGGGTLAHELGETRMGVTGSHGIHTHPANNNYKVLYNGAKWSTLYSEIPKAEKTGKLDLRTQCMPRKLISMACQFR